MTGSSLASVSIHSDSASEPGTARAVLASMPAGGHVVVSSSMPVRDLEWFAVARPDVAVHSNRGANGIDGVVSTALGVALGSGAPTTCLLGDVALLHDSSGLTGLTRRGVDLLLVVVDNDGGGIFSFLPQAQALADDFEWLWGTPHGLDLVDVARAHGVHASRVAAAALAGAIDAALTSGCVQVLLVPSDRAANVACHRAVHAAVAAALDRA